MLYGCRSINVLLFPSLLALSAVPWRDSEAELKVLWAVSLAELAMFLSRESVRDGDEGIAA